MKTQAPHFPDGVAVVLGGSGGLGLVICEQLAAHGSDVAFTYRSNATAAARASDAIESAGRKSMSAPLDIGDPAATRAFFDNVAAKFGRIHTVIAATGASFTLDYVANIKDEEWYSTIHGDLDGFFHVVKAAIPHLRKGGGAFVALTSAALVRHSPKDILSTAPKAGIEALTRAIAREEGRFGIRANTVGVGAIDGGLMDKVWGQVSKEYGDAVRSNIPLRRLGLPADVANAVLFLASERSSFVTGQRVVVDGGYCV